MFLTHARSLRRANETVLALLENIPEKTRNEDRKSYYGSLHGLACHVLGGTVYFLKLFRDSLPRKSGLFTGLDEIFAPQTVSGGKDYQRLKEAFQTADTMLIALVESLDASDCRQPVKLDWYPDRESVPFHFLFNQLICHGLHHRGQISQILDELGIENDFSGIDREFLSE